MDKLPKHIADAISKDATSLGRHPAFPPEDEDTFVSKLVQERYDTLFGDKQPDVESMKRQLSELLTQCSERESAVQNALMGLCCAIVNKVFNIPADIITLKAKLVDTVDTSSQRLIPEKMTDFTFDDIDDMNGLSDEIYKRRLLDALVCGAMVAHENDYTLALPQLFNIDPELPALYKKIMSLNEKLMFIEKENLTQDTTSSEAGKVDVIMDMPSNSVQISAEGVIFPVLLGQVSKGLLELAIAHGLPEDRRRAKYVIGKADFRLAEQWDIRLGVSLWNIIKENFEGADIEDNFILMEIAKLPVEDFNRILREVFAKTKRGQSEMASLKSYIERMKGEDDFNDYMAQQNNTRSQIDDSEYFTPDELTIDPSPYLNESLLYEAASLGDIHAKYYADIPDDVFSKIVSADPTYSQDKPDKMGKFGKWLLSIYKKGNLKIEDLYKATEYLATFVKYYNRLENRDINKFGSLQDLFNAVSQYIENPDQATSKSDEERRLKENEAEKVYEDQEWLIVVPKTKEAACYYGKGTQWCTAATKSDNMFDYYNEDGPLYINIDKRHGAKYQFHFESKQFMDERDREVYLGDIGLSNGAINFYRTKVVGNKFMMYLYGAMDAAEINGAPGYFFQDNYNYGFFHLEDDGTVTPLKYDDDYGYYVEDYDSKGNLNSYTGRYVLLTTSDRANLYDLHEGDTVFNYNDVNEIKTDMFENGTSDCFIVNCTDGTSLLFNPKTGKIDEEFPEAARVREYGDSGVYLRPYPIENMTLNAANPYESLLKISNETGRFAIYSAKTHKYLTDFVYAASGKESMFVNGKEYKFLVMSREPKFQENMNEWEVLLPDGSVTNYDWLAQNADNVEITKQQRERR